MVARKIGALCLVELFTVSLFISFAAEQSQHDRDALVEIDRDMDVHNKLNWYNPADGSSPEDGQNWSWVQWSSGPEGRVRSIWNVSRVLSGESDGFAKLQELEMLGMNNGNIPHIRWLSGLYKLRYLHMSENKIQNIDGISLLRNLEALKLFKNEIRDINPFVGLNKLKYLHLSYNLIENIDALGTLPSLTELHLAHNRVTSATAFSGMAKLEKLFLNNNRLFEINGMEGLAGLQYLYLSDNFISDASPLYVLPNLIYLEIGGNRLSLSQLYPLMRYPWLYPGVQREVSLPALEGQLFVGIPYDLRSESVFDGYPTKFTLHRNSCGPAIPCVDYTFVDGILTFLTDGDYMVTMENDAIYTHDPNLRRNLSSEIYGSDDNPITAVRGQFPRAVVKTKTLSVKTEVTMDGLTEELRLWQQEKAQSQGDK